MSVATKTVEVKEIVTPAKKAQAPEVVVKKIQNLALKKPTSKEPNYRFFRNNGEKTVVLGTKHPNVNLWLPSKCVLKLTVSEVEESGLERYKDFEEMAVGKQTKDALRPDAARKAVIDSKFKKDTLVTEKNDKDDDSLTRRPTLSKTDPLTGKPVNTDGDSD